ncbi:MAG: DNA mismatch repair protein MutS [Chloroflexi bacterium]|nr:DNA mismatch repair protein MutS [Chloroflexota bacterium]
MSSDVPRVRQQYLDIKKQYPHAIVFFRLGDFYETFDSDAELIARELDIVLTSREYTNQRVPMAGVPHHAVENYLARLIAKGFHIAICEQMGSEPIKGLFPREVTRVVTPGTIVEPGLLAETRNNFLAAALVDAHTHRAGLAFVDITTGQFQAAQLELPSPSGRGDRGEGDITALLRHELTRLAPAELLAPADGAQSPLPTLAATPLPPHRFDLAVARQLLHDHFSVSTLAGFGIEHQPLAIRCAGAILQYIKDTRPNALSLLVGLGSYSTAEFMTLDPAARRNLELTETIRGGQVRGSLLGTLDKTVTPMGARLLRVWVNQPLLNLAEINSRLDSVSVLHTDGVRRAEIRAALKPLGDLERLVNRVLGGTATPRDLGAIRSGLAAIPRLKQILQASNLPGLGSLDSQTDPSPDIHSLLCSALADDDLPSNLDHPGVIRPGWSSELDGVAAASKGARDWIAGLEKVERERSRIKTLKVGFNKVFGYYIEISKAAAENAPAHYIRKQTLVNAERFITPELKEYETLVLNAEERISEIEARLFKEACAQIAAQAARLLNTARALARLDVFAALAEVAANNNYSRPVLTADSRLEIRDGRHPVVEHFMQSGERFVPNGIAFDPGECVRVITGPNMSGKSTYLRQAALIVLMAQIGSFVPASSASLGIVDRIFTRIGAQDEIHAGQSTFMVEMVETANILHHATYRSLLVLDEIGRGTSTYDGLSLAWAIIEYIHSHPRLRAKTLFATHYHELTELANLFPGVRNYNVAVTEDPAAERVVFLHRIVPGGADRSYGIHVAQMAGLPKPVINRAQELLAALESSSGKAVQTEPSPIQQIALFPETNPLRDELASLDISSMTPLEALNKLFEWQRRFGEEKK